MRTSDGPLKRCYALYFLAIYALYLALLLLALRGRNPAFTIDFSTVVMPAIEIGLLCMLGFAAWKIQHAKLAVPAVCVFLAMPLSAMFIYAVQGYSAYLSGHYISVLALENSADGRQYVTKPSFLFVLSLGLAGWIYLCFSAIRTRKQCKTYPLGGRFLLCLAVVCLLFVRTITSPTNPTGYVHIRPDMVPITSLARKYRDMYRARNSLADMTKVLDGQGITLPSLERYPLLRKEAYSTPLMFPKTHLADNQPNVIVIFAEGLSARFLQTYGGNHQGLMPNVDRFASKSMTVDNYFSHTAATYRGIQGQLTSGYPRNGGSESGGWETSGEDNTALLTSVNYRTIPDILASQGYKTAFLSSSPESIKFNEMLRWLGFGKVYSVETLSELLGGRKTALSSGTHDAADAEIFAGLKGFLEKQAKSGDKQPFFVGTYNIGTHAFLDSDSAGITYNNGKNPALNRMHNFDAQLGKFLDYFQNSTYADNTLLIITADHATFPEPPVVEALQTDDYQSYFVDRIPLIIYHRGLSLPSTFDASYRTSVDFAPTLLHLLSIQKADNAFIGYSIFEQPPKFHTPVAAFGDEFYYVTPQGITTTTENLSDRYIAYKNYVKMYYWLEFTNRVFPRPTSHRDVTG